MEFLAGFRQRKTPRRSIDQSKSKMVLKGFQAAAQCSFRNADCIRRSGETTALCQDGVIVKIVEVQHGLLRIYRWLCEIGPSKFHRMDSSPLDANV